MTAAPVEITVKRYVCPFCSRGRAKKAATAGHIGRCWWNPENHGCKTCEFYEPEGDRAECFPGTPCSCNDYPESCRHDDGPRELKLPVINCPLWEAP